MTYRIPALLPHIAWTYFFHAWGIKPKDEQTAESQELKEEALNMLAEWDEKVEVRCLLQFFTANSMEDDLLIAGKRFPLLRQQMLHEDGSPSLCLSDFVRPLSMGKADKVGLFAASVDERVEQPYRHDPYRHLLAQTLCDRLVEAAVEKLHGETMEGGIRPAVGYPSLPDQSVNFLLDELLDMKQIGITLTEHGAMHPHASVCGLMLRHPQARYFAVGKIGLDQLTDYARRRDLPVEVMKKFLAANL